MWEESFWNSLRKIKYSVCSSLCQYVECFLTWYQMVPIQNCQWVDWEEKTLFYNMLLVKAEKDIHKFEFGFAYLMFSFTSICLDGTLTPSKRNHACVTNLAEESTAHIALVICCSLTTPKWCALVLFLCQWLCYGAYSFGLFSTLNSSLQFPCVLLRKTK